MDLNQLYHDHQVSLIRAQDSATPQARDGHEAEAGRLAGHIQNLQGKLGAAAACALMARIGERAA